MNRVRHACTMPGCANLAPCQEHRRGGNKGPYDAAWRALALWWLARHPWCALCARWGRRERADHVHHIIPISRGGGRLDKSNLRSLCIACHGTVTRREPITSDWKRYATARQGPRTPTSNRSERAAPASWIRAGGRPR